MLHALVAARHAPTASGLRPARQRIAKVTIQPAEVAVQVGDTVRLAATAVDSAGRPVRDVTVAWFQSGGYFEGKVDSTGLVTGGLDRHAHRECAGGPERRWAADHRLCPGHRSPPAGEPQSRSTGR